MNGVTKFHIPRVCIGCNTLIHEGPIGKKFCSKECWKKYTISSRESRHRCTTGAMSELIVCADLLGKGYEVFRSLSPHSSCDMIVLKDGKIIRIESRTGQRREGKFYIPFGNKDIGRSDILAVVVESKVFYFNTIDRSPTHV